MAALWQKVEAMMSSAPRPPAIPDGPYPRWPDGDYITTWAEFNRRIRSPGIPLLGYLGRFPNSVLVTGCQRSGTTMLTRILTLSRGMTNYWFGPDDELDAALILSGYVQYEAEGRHCFQTTYVGPGCEEYIAHRDEGHKIVFVLRNPFSVIYSMLYNWSDAALNLLFVESGVPELQGADRLLWRAFGMHAIGRLRRACWAYRGKLRQLFVLRQHFSSEQLMVVDYDDLVRRKELMLPAIYAFVRLPYDPRYAERIHARSLRKIQGLSERERSTIRELCEPLYAQARSLCDPLPTEPISP